MFCVQECEGINGRPIDRGLRDRARSPMVADSFDGTQNTVKMVHQAGSPSRTGHRGAKPNLAAEVEPGPNRAFGGRVS
jgi:hypothetical protein